ncbi:flavin reductase family protein [Microvirga sp. W0021]|uniref:Flavin reductase family protein n=1 Tax=Hohaiivirga grylli TaxID=3133970 RepID=A0ABV0BKK2_9HYPH
MFYQTDLKDHGLPHDPFKALVAPRPIGWISAINGKGEINLSPYSFFNAVCDTPPMVMFSSTGRKDALSFIEETKEFVCNIATYPLREQMNISSAPFPRGVNEMEKAGLKHVPSTLIKAPRLAETPAALECRWLQTISLADINGNATGNHMVVGQVVGVYIDERFIKDGLVDTAAMQPILRAGYHDYFTALEAGRFSMTRPTISD